MDAQQKLRKKEAMSDLEVIGAGWGRTGTLTLKVGAPSCGAMSFAAGCNFHALHNHQGLIVQHRGSKGPLLSLRAWFSLEIARHVQEFVPAVDVRVAALPRHPQLCLPCRLHWTFWGYTAII